MIHSILMEAGYKVGLYTSPHLVSPRERIRVNEEWISKEHFVQGIQLLREIISKRDKFYPTYFELVTALAFHHFFEARVDFVVLETGMGGRLDSTNIADSKVQVITNIDLEHTRFLGKTVSEIAQEKAGIIKHSSFVVTGTWGPALEVIEARSNAFSAHLMRLGHEIHETSFQQNLEGQKVIISTKKDRYEATLRLLGKHQSKNSALAVGAIESLQSLGYLIQKKDVIHGLERAKWSGRFEILKRNPWVIFDAAHNPAAVQVLLETWRDYFRERKAHLIFSALEDKDVQSMAKTLSEITQDVTLVELSNHRALTLNRLQEIWENCIAKEKIRVSSVQDALHFVQKDDEKESPVLITGSIYLLGEILAGLSKVPVDHLS
jgi:dihydrofolate synthase/folylpolyglutamate synthase